MAKILLGIALAVLLATAALGFLAKGNAEKLQGILTTTKQDLGTTRATLAKTKDELKTRTEELTAANAKVDERDKEIANLKGQTDDLNKKVAEATTAMEAKTTELAATEKKYTDHMATHGGTKQPIANDETPEMKALRADFAKAQAEAAESKALVDSLTAKKKEMEDKMTVLEQYKKRKETEIMRIGVGGRILAVNGGWNFVVISIGDKQGAVMNATMLVVRDGTPIGKVRITSVEPTSSIADILPGSLRKGVTIQPGDNVIFEGRTPATGTAPAGAPAASAALPLR